MKFGVLTWYKAINHGAILQAYASQQVLKSCGISPIFLDYEWLSGQVVNPYRVIKSRFRKLITGDFRYRKIYHSMKKEKETLFRRFREENIDDIGDCYGETYDTIMVGSDMVFGLQEGWQPYMFGIGLQAKKFFSYAACSGGSSSIKVAQKYGYGSEIRQSLSKFSGLGVRDKETENFIKAMGVEQKAISTIDPVLLYGYKEEMEAWDTGKWKQHEPYLLIYSYFSHMNGRNEVRVIKKYAEQKNLKIVSCGYYHPWCHENVNADPKEFLEMFMSATAVVTDTFHGTVFSLINSKDFVSVLRGNSFKVKDLLCKCGMEDRIVNSDTMFGVLSTKVDYSHFYQWLEKERSISKQYILSQIES